MVSLFGLIWTTFLAYMQQQKLPTAAAIDTDANSTMTGTPTKLSSTIDKNVQFIKPDAIKHSVTAIDST